MNKIINGLLLLLFTLPPLTLLSAQTAGRREAPKLTAVRAGRLIDVRSGNVVNNAVILIEDERITAVGPQITIPTGAQVVDLGNMTLLPGLIDCHTHVLLQPEDERGAPPVITKSQALVLEVRPHSPIHARQWSQRCAAR